MTVTQIPADGASKRFKAAQENAMAEKVQLVEKTAPSHTDNLRRKVEYGENYQAMVESKGWIQLTQDLNTRYSFDNIMIAFKNKTDQETYKEMMIQRQAIETMIKNVRRYIEEGKLARNQLAQEEKSK